MKKSVAFVFLATFILMGCGEDKKAVIPTKLDNSIPQVQTAGGGKAKGPGGESKAE